MQFRTGTLCIILLQEMECFPDGAEDELETVAFSEDGVPTQVFGKSVDLFSNATRIVRCNVDRVGGVTFVAAFDIFPLF